MANTVVLYRPVGQRELDLLEKSDFSSWPPRLPDQPIFYPVTNEEYAAQIAREWNTKDALNGNVGFVTRFAVESDYLSQFQVETVGGSEHTEYWIPSERLDEFNQHIVGKIEVIRKFLPEGEVDL
ncbi:MAG: hypothetical protein CMO55_20550 [Verrucomicrobiales bacterium]|nr:hypothetical protein [Verrucomicrobiales bacterium]